MAFANAGNVFGAMRFHDETRETLERVQEIVSRVFGESAAIQDDGPSGYEVLIRLPCEPPAPRGDSDDA